MKLFQKFFLPDLRKYFRCYFLNGAAATQYIKLEKGAQQGGTLSAYMFILCLEILFTIVNKNKDII